ncbi:MAG: class I SAM-dependent methyltransferase [Bacteroidia bacterium]
MTDKSNVVKELFENTALYLTYDYNLQIRKETVEVFTKGLHFTNVLDIPCGTGAMSIPLLERADKLTLIDISANMLDIAKNNIPETSLHKIETINADFFKLDLENSSYDIIICLGLLAHVNSPEQLLNRLSNLLKPGGLIIIQNTDSSHVYSFLIRTYLGLKNLIRKQSYKLNKVPASFLENTLKKNNLEFVRSYRYNQSFLGFSNLFSNDKKYKMTRSFFGDAVNPKNQSFGSDYTYLFRKKK